MRTAAIIESSPVVGTLTLSQRADGSVSLEMGGEWSLGWEDLVQIARLCDDVGAEGVLK